MNVPEHACILNIHRRGWENRISVYIDQGTSQSFLPPGFPTDETEVVWNAVLLGNPVRGGKILTSITWSEQHTSCCRDHRHSGTYTH